MARHEHDREDLLAEATALVPRAELRVHHAPDTVVVGFRRGGASVYFGGDPAYHFNVAAELRRAYVSGRLIKAEQGRLVALERHRHPDHVDLVRHDLDDRQAADFLAAMHERLRALREAMRSNGYALLGQVPEGEDVAGRIRRWLDGLPDAIDIADRPHAQ